MDVHVNAAMSADGKLSTVDREQIRISGDRDFQRVDAMRADVDAVMVGIGTVMADDPSLTVDDPGLIEKRKDDGREPQPVRVVADSRARIPLDARILDETAETIILVAETAPSERRDRLTEQHATVRVAGDSRVDLVAGLDALESDGISSIMVEGGGELLASFFEAGLVDTLTVYIGSMVIGGADAPTLVDGAGFSATDNFPQLVRESVSRLDDGILVEWSINAE